MTKFGFHFFHLVIIIGGGISGLSAAYELATRRAPFVLLESTERAGGLVRTDHVDGFTIDAGADSMLATKPAAIELCEELGLGPRLMSTTPPRTAFVHAHGRLHALPSPSVFGIPTTRAGLAEYSLLPPAAREHLARAMDTHEALAQPDDESVADFFRRHFGAETVGLVAEPLLGGIHAGDVEKLSVNAVAPKLVAAARNGRLFQEPSTSGASGEGLFRALDGGMGELVSAIESRLPPGSVRVRNRARAITFAGGAWKVACDDDVIDARAVIVAAPAHAAAGLVVDCDPLLSRLCAEVPYASTVSIALGWPRARVEHPLTGSGFVVSRRHSDLRITACTWVSSKWQNRAAPGMVLLRAFLGGLTDPDVLLLSDDALVELAVRDVSGVLGVSGAPQMVRVQRWDRAGAQHNVGHAAHLARVDERLAALPGLLVAGSGFHSIGVPDCVADGRAAAVRAAALADKMPF